MGRIIIGESGRARGERNGKKEEGKRRAPCAKERRLKETERSLGPAVEGAKEDKEKGGGGPPY